MSVQLVTAQEVEGRLVGMRGGDMPKGLQANPQVLEDLISGVSAQMLQRIGRTTPPDAGVELEALREVALELCCIKIRLGFTSLDGGAMQALNTRWNMLWGSIPEAEAYQQGQTAGTARSSITPKRQFAPFGDDHERVVL